MSRAGLKKMRADQPDPWNRCCFKLFCISCGHCQENVLSPSFYLLFTAVFVSLFPQEANDRFEERRKENASGRRVATSQFEMSTKEKQSSYADVFEDLTWFPLASFVVKAGGSLVEWDTEEKQLIFVQEVCKQDVVYVGGLPGVNVLDHEDGRKKIRRGIRTSIDKEQENNNRQSSRAVFSLLIFSI